MKNSYLQYTGKWRIIVDIIKKGKKDGSRAMVPTSLPSMVKRFFEEDDLLDEKAINYYKQFEDLNVHLHLDNEDNHEEQSIDNWTTNEESVEEPIEDIQNLISETPIEATETGISEEIQEQPEEELTESPLTEESVEEPVSSEEIPVIEESDRAEMIAYLDATYDKDGLKNLAKELGVEFNSRISIEKLIEKLIDEKSAEILEMMK